MKISKTLINLTISFLFPLALFSCSSIRGEPTQAPSRIELGSLLTEIPSTQTPTPLPEIATSTLEPKPFFDRISPIPINFFSDQSSCISDFDTFAYTVLYWGMGYDPGDYLPLEPWKIATDIPVDSYNPPFDRAVVKLIRKVEGLDELWVKRFKYEFGAFSDGEYIGANDIHEYYIYQIDTGAWKVISAYIGDTGLYVDQIFMGNDGTIWGRNIGESTKNLTIEEVPLLSKYNESTSRFELLEGGMKFLVTEVDRDFFDWPEVVLDDQEGFWIIVAGDGIYSYTPENNHLLKHEKIDLDQIGNLSLTSNKQLFVQGNDYDDYPDWSVYRFSIVSGEVSEVQLPADSWPWGEIFVDHENNLWFGAVSYLSPGGGWNLLHPDIEGFAEAGSLGPLAWVARASPHIIFESSNGLMWFERDGGWDWNTHSDGTAWYDPETGAGCWFTTVTGGIAEDSSGTLWTVADGQLYKLDLYP
ncbi:MAG: hypothetical protein OEV06_00635 [Anaerolineae bacterium]|nr:hypothetical protein [Anaerolineae bacterium]